MDELDEILKKIWQNGYQINRWEDLKQELEDYYKEKFAKELEIEEIRRFNAGRHSNEFDIDNSMYGLRIAAGIIRGKNERI